MMWPNMTDNNSIILDYKVFIVVLLKQPDKFPYQLVLITSQFIFKAQQIYTEDFMTIKHCLLYLIS